MIVRTAIPCPAAAYAGSAIYLRGVVFAHLSYPVVAVSHPIASRLISCCHHHKGWVVAVCVDDALRLLQQILVYLLTAVKLYSVIRPRWTLWLQIHTQLVGSGEGCLWWAEAMETHMVQAILLALLEHARPLPLVHRRKARFWEAAVLHRASQEHWAAIDVELSSFYRHFAQAESHRHLYAFIFHSTRIKTRIELVPQLNIISQSHFKSLFVDDDIHPFFLQVRHYLLTPNDWLSLQLQAPHNAVPVALCLVGHRMGVLPHAHILDTIIDADGNDVFLAPLHELRHVVAMGC